MSVYKKIKVKIPYLVSIVFPTGVWAFLCAAFGAFLILGRADFEATGTKTVFTITFPLCMIGTLLIAFAGYGILRIFGVKIEKNYLKLLNDNIENGHLLPGLPSETIRGIFSALTREPARSLRAGYKYGVLIISSTLLIEWFASGGQTINLPIMFISGSVSCFFVVVFGSSFSERSVYNIAKECREELAKRGESAEECEMINLKRKFNYFLLIPLLLIVLVLSFVPFVDFNIIIFSFIGFIMIIIISKALSSSIYLAFSELETFAKELSGNKQKKFFTGSLTKEIVSVSYALNQAVEEIYFSQKEIEDKNEKLKKSYEEIKKKKDELEKFYNLTVGRELKMVELKKENEELRERLKNELK